MEQISVAGLGKLGLCMAACIAAKGFKVIGVDIDANRIRQLRAGECPIAEKDLPELLERVKGNLQFTTDMNLAAQNSIATFVVVATPSDPSGSFSNEYLMAAMAAIGDGLRGESTPHYVVVTSTVMPGTLDGPVRSLLESRSGKKCGNGMGLAYNPEFIALGTVIRDFQNPDFVLVGQSDDATGDFLQDFYRRVCNNNPPVARMNLISAEIAKLSLNCYVTMKISFANTLAEVCEKSPGADIDAITSGIGIDRRIGLPYLRGGLGFGGPCFPRDNQAFAAYAQKVGAQSLLPRTVHAVNCHQVERIVDLSFAGERAVQTAAVLGLAYKPGTNIVEASQAMDIAASFVKRGLSVTVFDPMGTENARRTLNHTVQYADSAEACIRDKDLVVIATAWPEFAKLNLARLVKAGAVVVDCWRIFEKQPLGGIRYLPVGRSFCGSEQDRPAVSQV